ncbi:unnamed protein product [Peniophora sp. CBMAI 1063]|nr:unnamed protein product [Peniophora sp. CBMAI 1063]
MAKFRLLDAVRPLTFILPDVSSPGRQVPFNLKIMFTSLSALLFLWMSQIKPFGTLTVDTPDPLYSVRGSIAASKGSLTELGVLPILTSGFTLQLLASARLIDVNFSLKEDRALFGFVQKVFAVVAAIVQATLIVLAGVYGTPTQLGLTGIAILVAQLSAATLVLALLDELLEKGHGLGSGSMLFIGAHACTTAVWGVLSLRWVDTARGQQYEGALPALLQFVFGWNSVSRGLKEAFWRAHLPNVLDVVATLAVVAACAFLQRVRVEFPVKHTRYQGQRGAYPIRILYTGVVPLMAAAALRANLLLDLSAIAGVLPDNIVTSILGSWVNVDGSLVPVGGLASLLVPPTSLINALLHPIQTVVYTAFNVSAAAIFSSLWLSASASEPFHVSKQLQEQQLTMVGHREGSMSKEFKRVIPGAAFLGAVVISAVGVLGDITGALAGGAGTFMGLHIVQTYMAMGMMESGYGEMPGAAAMMDTL